MPVATWEPHPCSTGCGGTVDIVAGSTPREPLRCDPCQAALGPLPVVYGHPCDRDGCDQLCDRITGAQRLRWARGRPVYCSKACRKAATSGVESCGYCRTPLLVNRRWADSQAAIYCSRVCGHSALRNPEKPCARCGKLFHGLSRRRFCSRACGQIGEGAPGQRVQRVCPVCGDRAMVHPSRARRPCSKACSNRWRNMPGWEPKGQDGKARTGTSPLHGSSQSSSRPQGSAPLASGALAPASPH